MTGLAPAPRSPVLSLALAALLAAAPPVEPTPRKQPPEVTRTRDSLRIRAGVSVVGQLVHSFALDMQFPGAGLSSELGVMFFDRYRPASR